jgi:hypothetical protein
VADERDVIKLRTNFRGEDVYLYRLRVTQAAASSCCSTTSGNERTQP